MKSKEHAYARKQPRDLQHTGWSQVPSLLKIEKTKNMKREIKVTKKTNDQPMTTIKITKSMTIKIKIAKSMTIKMKAKTYLQKKMIMVTKTSQSSLIND